MSPLESDLDTLARHYYDRFGAMDFAAMRAICDMDDPEPTYLAEEIEEFLRDWPSIEAYWAASKSAMSRLSSRHWDLKARRIAGDLATATWRLHWNADVVGFKAPVAGDLRVTAIFRHRPQGWRLLHYVEAPLAPILYIRKLYETRVDPDFLAGR